jgi:hypothetical protein
MSVVTVQIFKVGNRVTICRLFYHLSSFYVVPKIAGFKLSIEAKNVLINYLCAVVHLKERALDPSKRSPVCAKLISVDNIDAFFCVFLA